MRVRFLADHDVKLSAIAKKTYPKGWTGEIDDQAAVAAIIAGAAEDPNGEVTIAAIEAEVARRQAIIDAGGDPDAPAVEPVDLKKLDIEQLRAIAAECGIDGAKLGKGKLIAAIEAHVAQHG